MDQTTPDTLTKSSVDQITDHLYKEITSLRLLPGARISETEIAQKFGVSRQPVRDAFNRLATMDLIRIRPKKATEVKKFSTAAITKSRYIRAAIEAAVLRDACKYCDVEAGSALDSALSLQKKALADRDTEAFGKLDYAFHKTLCDIAKAPFAYEVIQAEKAKVDRLCVLSLAKEDRMPELVSDHEKIAEAVKAGDETAAQEAGMIHLSRLDDTIARIRVQRAAFFDDESAAD